MSETVARDSGWVLPSVDAWRATSGETCVSPAPGQKEAVSSSSLKKSILIVEDDDSARKAITRILKRRGFAVCEARTVADALRCVSEQPEWVLLDLMLPDGCGISVIEKVKTDGLSSKVCIITGCGSEMLDEARRAGAGHAFIKPLNVDRLMTLLCA